MDGIIEEKDREVDFRQCLLYIWDHILIIILCAALIACAAGGYGYLKQGKSKVIKKTFDEIVSQNRSAYYPDGTKTVINTERKKLDNTCIIRGEIFIDYDFSTIEGNSNLDFSAMVYRLQQDAVVRMVSDKTLRNVAEKVSDTKYDNIDDGEVTAEELRWLINISFSGANVMQYSVTDINTDRALDIAKLISDSFIKEASSFETFDAVRVLEEPAVFADSTVKGASISLKPVVKFAIIGGIAGLILICGIYFLIFVFVDTVRVSADLDYTELDTLGRIPSKEKLRDNEYRRIAYRLSLCEGINKVLVAPVDPKTAIDDIVEKVTDELKEQDKSISLIKTNDVVSSPDALIAANKADAVILVATYGKTRIKDIEYSRNEISKTGKKLLGAVIDRAKHK